MERIYKISSSHKRKRGETALLYSVLKFPFGTDILWWGSAQVQFKYVDSRFFVFVQMKYFLSFGSVSVPTNEYACICRKLQDMVDKMLLKAFIISGWWCYVLLLRTYNSCFSSNINNNCNTHWNFVFFRIFYDMINSFDLLEYEK